MNKKEQIENHIKGILSLIGEDVNREGLKGTPDRIARMYNEIFRGYDASQKPKITTFENGKDGITYENMIIDEGDFYSMCEHHMMPFLAATGSLTSPILKVGFLEFLKLVAL